MSIQVNQELCAGCGACIDVCCVGAIQLVDQVAVIDNGLCTQCEACIDACPNGAINAFAIPARSISIAVSPAPESQIVPITAQPARLETATLARGLVPLAGSLLTFLGREIAPRLADMLMAVLERRLARSTSTANPLLSTPSGSYTAPRGKGERRRARYRGGRTANRIHIERR